MMAVMAETCSQ